jgi:hypothetical protein
MYKSFFQKILDKPYCSSITIWHFGTTLKLELLLGVVEMNCQREWIWMDSKTMEFKLE